MIDPEFADIVDGWKLPQGGSLLDRIKRMIQPALMDGHFGSSTTRLVSGLQYHLGGQHDTEELAGLASVTSNDHVLDVCCFIGGPAIQLTESFGCRVTGVDISKNCIAAARRIAGLAGLWDSLDFCVGDAGSLPFGDGEFTVVWSQASLQNYDAWLKEFDRVLAPRGRLALTFEIGRRRPTKHTSRWRLQDIVRFAEHLGYSVDHADEITDRDIEMGWKELDRGLSEREGEFIAVLGEDWVRSAHKQFAREIQEMLEGKWGNGRMVAIKKAVPDGARYS